MNRYGIKAFWRRFFNAFGNGQLKEKLRRRLWRMGPLIAHRRKRVSQSYPVAANKVLFVTSSYSCTCNPRAIARELARQRPDVDIVWILDDASYRACQGRPETGRAVRRWTWAAYRELATAHVLVENSHFFVSLGNPEKRPGQRYMNTWHGSLGIKRLDAGRSATTGQGVQNSAKVDALLSNSDFDDTVFAESPLASAPRVRTGHPRNDVFFLDAAKQSEIKAKVFAALGLPETTHLALVAPTFRDEALTEGANVYDFNGWRKALEDRFGGSWTLVLRLHPLDARALAEGLISFPKGVANATDYPDMQELLIAADAGITDYSSWIYDYLLGGRPGFLFAPDKQAYDDSHGFYYPLESTPFPVAETNEELCARIRAFDAETFARDKAAFLSEKGCMEDGRASERAVDVIGKWLAEGVK